jgi:hypothetical protein
MVSSLFNIEANFVFDDNFFIGFSEFFEDISSI